MKPLFMLGQLRFIATTSSDPTHQQLLKLVRIAENDLMSKLMEYFESFLESELYRDWQRNSQMKENRRLSTNRYIYNIYILIR